MGTMSASDAAPTPRRIIKGAGALAAVEPDRCVVAMT